MPTRNSCPTSIQDTLRTTVMCGRRRPRGSARRAPSMEAPNGSWMRALVGASQPSRSRELTPVRRVHLSAGQIRFCRLWAKYLGSKVSLQWANSEKLPFTSDSFDLVQYTYILHGMPTDTAFRVPTEMYRVMKSDGVLSGLEVPYFTFATTRDFLTNIFTWGLRFGCRPADSRTPGLGLWFLCRRRWHG